MKLDKNVKALEIILATMGSKIRKTSNTKVPTSQY